MVSEELEHSLREEIAGFIGTRINEVQEQVSRLQDEINNSFARFREQQPSSELEPALSDTISGHLKSAHETGMEEAVSASSAEKAASGMAVIKAAIDDIDDQRSQAEILGMLVNHSAAFAPRVAFFVVKGDGVSGWRARGLEGSVGDDAVQSVRFSTNTDSSVKEAIASRGTFSGGADTYQGDRAILNAFGGETPQRIAAIPLVVRGKAVAVLYADSGTLEPEAVNVEALETLVRVTGMAVELLSVSRAAPVSKVQYPAEQAAPEPAPAAAPEPVAAAPEPAPAPQPAPEPEPQPEYVHVPVSEPEPVHETVREPEPEALPAPPPPAPEPVRVETAPAFGETTAPYVAPLGTKKRYGSSDADLPVDVSDDEKRLHNDARRFARLLVSEIKLYNEQKVREGRAQSDIYERLREDIDRSREMYEKRVAPPVAARFDYFHNELVNTLAEGDEAKLGDGYHQSNA